MPNVYVFASRWVSSLEEFIPTAWWAALKAEAPLPMARNTPIVMGVDGSVSGDCTAIVGVSRHPDTVLRVNGPQAANGTPNAAATSTSNADMTSRADSEVVIRFAQVWFPPKNGTIDYAEVKATILEFCKTYNVAQICYDPYQMHSTMQEILTEAIAWCKPFSQAGDREKADKQLYDMIRDRKLHHNDEFDVQFVKNAASRTTVAEATGTGGKIERMRIVKKSSDTPIDPVIALSMAVSECRRLNLV